MRYLITTIKTQINYMGELCDDVLENCNKVLNGATELINNISWDLSILDKFARDLKDLSFQLDYLHIGD